MAGLAVELLRALGTARKQEHRERDRELIETTGIRSRRSARRQQYHDAAVPPALTAPAGVELAATRTCYVCKESYSELHHFYDGLCPACGDRHFAKRAQTADMAGMVAVVTGARIKIGYQVALKLLRAGARVIVTTRFPIDAAQRYGREDDFLDWRERLILHAIDLRRLGEVERFADFVRAHSSRLDVLINNAAQTIRRPPAFYRHLIDVERFGVDALPPAVRSLVVNLPGSRDYGLPAPTNGESQALARRLVAELTQLPWLPEDRDRNLHDFPLGEYDEDRQQVDRRVQNSWTLELGDVSTCELLEVHAVNCLAPFLLIRGLEPLLRQHRSRPGFIVNVSAMEGKLAMAYKTGRHPHTNMAKAALNMITRTCAERYASAGIFLNSVDTGWVTNEAPHPTASAMAEQGFQPPLDEIDGAARVCDPIFAGLNTGRPIFGKFLKDYRAVAW